MKVKTKAILRFALISFASIFIFSSGYWFGGRNYSEELNFKIESIALQDSAINLSTLILPEVADKFDSAAIYSRINKKYAQTFRFNYEDTLKTAITSAGFLKSRFQILKAFRPYYIEGVTIEKDYKDYIISLNLRTIDYTSVLRYLSTKDTTKNYKDLYKDTEMNLKYVKKGDHFLFNGFQ